MSRRQGPGVAEEAKLFKHGGSQAVRLPKAFRFEGDRVHIRKEGDKVILEPVGHTETDEEWLARIRMPDFMPGGREPMVLEEPDWSFDDEASR